MHIATQRLAREARFSNDAMSAAELGAAMGDSWCRYQTARIEQRHLQFGRHSRLDVRAILSRLALAALAVRPRDVGAVRRQASGDFMRQALIGAIEHCARLDAVVPARES